MRLLLATRGLAGWQTQPLGGTLGANALLQFVGVLPSGDFVLWVDNRGGSPALYRVPSGGGAWQALVTLPGGRVFFPILQP